MIIRGREKIVNAFMMVHVGLSLFLVLGSIMLAEAVVAAETHYVKPSAEVVVRRGQGNEYKIVAMVKDGTAVQLLEEGEVYAKVVLANGKEGWMLKRFLSKELPLEDVVASLRREKEALTARETAARHKLEEVSSLLSSTERELASVVTERDQIRSEYQTLLRDTADVVKIKQDLHNTVKENEMLVGKLTVVQEERNKLKQDAAIKWFFVGGGVLLAGMLMGMIFSGSRRKKPSLL